MGSASSWTSLAVERRGAAVTTAPMITSPGFVAPGSGVPGSAVPGSRVPALHAGLPGRNATAVEVTPYLPLYSAQAPYLTLSGRN